MDGVSRSCGAGSVRPAAIEGRDIEANFQLLQQVSVYQTGVALMDYVRSRGPTLKVPAENDNILDRAGCRGFVKPALRCIRLVGGVPLPSNHRVRAATNDLRHVHRPGARNGVPGLAGSVHPKWDLRP